MSEQSLFLKIGEDGKPETHPMLEQNLKDVLENFDPNNPPSGYVKFVKTPLPVLDEYEKYDYLDYERSPELTQQYGQETWHEVHHVVKIEPDERNEIIAKFKELNPDLQDWVYDEATRTLVPPIPKPQDGKNYLWHTNDHKWMEIKPEMHFDDMIQVAKELGIDLAAGEFGRPDISEDTINKILEHMKKGN